MRLSVTGTGGCLVYQKRKGQIIEQAVSPSPSPPPQSGDFEKSMVFVRKTKEIGLGSPRGSRP